MMSRTILLQCLPCVAALLFSCVCLRLVIRICGAHWNFRRLRDLNRCEHGGVQSLSFVLTVPVFVMIVLFVVQVSQLMLGILVVHYAAFATARAAIVWVPARVADSLLVDAESENVLPPPLAPQRPITLVFDESQARGVAPNSQFWEYRALSTSPRSNKYANVFTAAAMACVPLAPSHDWGYFNGLQNESVEDVTKQLYDVLVPMSAQNTRTPQRIANKLAYSFMNTEVYLRFHDKDSVAGPSYNPQIPIDVTDHTGSRRQTITHEWVPEEVGWQDTITVTVTHHFALLPGPGRFLAAHLVGSDDRPDRVSPRIQTVETESGEKLYTTPVSATATMTNEGLKSVLPYVQTRL